MRKMFIGALTLFLAAGLSFASPSKTKAATTPVLYIVPHADDEVLTYGVDIVNQIHEGRPVYMVLASEGEHSMAREVENGQYDSESLTGKTSGEIYCKWHHRYHNPITEHYRDGYLTRAKFGTVRVRDFYAAGVALGIPRTHLFHERLPNDAFTYDDVHTLIAKYHAMFPTAEIRTMSEYDVHPDHAMLGKVLKDMKARGELGGVNVRYFVSILTDRFAKVKIPVKTYREVFYKAYEKRILQRGISVYKRWDPEHGFYANGYHSVPAQFDSLESGIYTRYYY